MLRSLDYSKGTHRDTNPFQPPDLLKLDKGTTSRLDAPFAGKKHTPNDRIVQLPFIGFVPESDRLFGKILKSLKIGKK